MRAVVIVVVAPCSDQLAGMAQAGQQVLVQALVPQAAIEALDEAVSERPTAEYAVPAIWLARLNSWRIGA